MCLTATDSAGLQDTDCSNIKADEVTYTFNTVPSGLPITYAGSRYETPFKVKTYVDARRIVEAPAETDDGLRFDGWSDGGEAVHEIVIGESPQTLTATYVDASGTAAGDQAASDQAAADAALVTPEDTGQTTGAAHTDDGHDHGAAGEASSRHLSQLLRQARLPTIRQRPLRGPPEARPSSPNGGAAWADTTVEELTKSDAYRKQAPSQQVTLDGLQLPRTGDKDYGVRVRGYLVPPVDGDYHFWIAADDRGAFFLSTDDSPDNKIVVAYTPQSTNAGEYEKNPEQITGPIALQAGQRYYFEVLYKQGDGKDNLSVAWQIPGEERKVIGAQYLEGYAGN